jgi:hypothetical protein
MISVEALSSDYCEYSTLGSESWALKERQVQTGSVPPWMSPQDVRADDGMQQRNGSTNEHVRDGCKLTHDGHVDGNAKMPMAPNSVQWKSQDLRGECLAHGVRRDQ